MKRFLVLLVALAVFATACGDGDDVAEGVEDVTTEAPVTNELPPAQAPPDIDLLPADPDDLEPPATEPIEAPAPDEPAADPDPAVEEPPVVDAPPVEEPPAPAAPPTEEPVEAPAGEIPPPAAGWERVQSRDDLSDLRVGQIEEVAWNDDQTVALIRYFGPAEPCSGSKVTVVETDNDVKFTLESGLPPDAAVISCIAAILSYEIAVPLAAPLGDRQVTLVDPSQVDAPPPADPFEGAVFPVDQYFGITEDEALALAAVEQRELRVVARDGEFFAVTEDFRPTRVNVEIVDGVIINAFSG